MKKLLTLFILTFFLTTISESQTRRVLFEEWTNASCGPCAASNPALKAWLLTKGDQVITIVYRTNFPGFDPMFNFNPSQLNERRSYYPGVNAVPWLKGDGNHNPDIWPFTNANFDAAFNSRINVPALVDITIADQRIAGGDSNKATVTVQVYSDLPAGNYKLRVYANERLITYQAPPGSNGETVFQYVFRRGYPDMTGVSIPTVAGTYVYEYTYYIDPVWQNDQIYTSAFVQNDAHPLYDILNANMNLNFVTNINPQTSNEVPERFTLEQNFPNPFNPTTTIKFSLPKNELVTLKVYNTLGQVVATLVNEQLQAGVYDFSFDAKGLTSGVYFYELKAGDFSDVKRLMLVK